jgi:hypothetical protein
MRYNVHFACCQLQPNAQKLKTNSHQNSHQIGPNGFSTIAGDSTRGTAERFHDCRYRRSIQCEDPQVEKNMASRRGFCFVASGLALRSRPHGSLISPACCYWQARLTHSIRQTSQPVRNEGRAMSVAPTSTPRILDRRQFRLVPIVLIAAFSWQWAMAQTVVPGALRIIHEIWTFKDDAPVAARAFAQTADGYRGDREGRSLYGGMCCW